MAHKVTVEIVADPRRLNAGLKEASASTNQFVRGLERTTRGALAGTVAISGMGRAIAFASAQFLGGYGLLYALTATVKSAVQFQQSMTLIQTQAGGTAAEVQRMTKAVLLLAPSVGTTPDELAKGLYHIESSGIRGAKAMETLKVAAQGAKLGSADLQQVVNGLVGAEISGIKGTEDLASTMGILDAIIGTGNLRMEEFSKALSSGIVPVARVFGLGLKDIGAALSTLTVHGIPAVMSANRLRTSLTFLAAGTPAAEKALSNIGLTTYKVGQMMRHQGLIPALEMISEHLKRSGLDATEQVQVISRAFGGARAGSTVIILLKYLEQLREHLHQIDIGAETFAQKWAAEQKTAQYATDRLRASVSTLSNFIGLALLPTVSRVAESMSVWLSKSENQKRVQDDLTKAVKATKAVLTPFYEVAQDVSKVLGGWSHLIEAILALKFARILMGWGAAAEATTYSMYRLATAEKAVAAGAVAAGASSAAVSGAAATAGGAAAGLVTRRGVTPLISKQAQREAAIARAGASGRFVHGGVPAENPLLFVPPIVTPVRAGMSTGGVDVMATKGAAASMAKLGESEKAMGFAAAAAATKAGALGLAVRALASVNPILITVTVLYIFRANIKNFMDNVPGAKGGKPGSWDPANIVGHIPGVAWLQNKSKGIEKILTLGMSSDEVKRWRKQELHRLGLDSIGNEPRFTDQPNAIDRVNPRIGTPGSGAYIPPGMRGVNLPNNPYEADKASKLQLQLDQARLQVAKGNTAANQLVVAILRKMIAMDEVAYKAQEKALKQGKGSAEKHTKNMSLLLQDEEKLFSEIAATKKQTTKKSWELPMALQVAQAWAANSDAISGDNSASTSVARQIAAIVSKQIKSGKLKGQDLLAAIGALTSAQQQIAQFNVPIKLQIEQAWAATTAGVGDDIAVATKLRDLIKAQIKAGKLRGAALLSALGQLAGAEATIRNNFNIPMKLQLAAAKAATTTVTTDDRKAAQGIKDFALAYLKSKKKTAEGMLAAYQAITGANQTLGQQTQQQTAYKMASTHALTAGLGLTRKQRITQEQRIAQMEAHDGRIPKGGWKGVLGYAVNTNPSGGTRGATPLMDKPKTPPLVQHGVRPQTAPKVPVNARPSGKATVHSAKMTVHTPMVTVNALKVAGGGGGGDVTIHIHGGDVREIERTVVKVLQKNRRYSAPQRRGGQGGHTLGVD